VTTLLRVRDLVVSFRHESGAVVEAVRGVSFEVPVESTVALVGESGSGKTASAMAVVGLLPVRTARIGPGSAAEFDGRDLLRMAPAELRALRGGQIATVFQEPMTSLNPVVTVGAQIAEVLRLHKRMGRAAAQRRAVELLDEVGLPEPARRARSHPHQLSGGQQQRAMIAMGIACEPRLLIADEPTTALDVTTQQQILELLASLRRRHRMSVLFITHDLGIVSDIADQVVVMQRGEVREAGPAAELLAHPVHPYTQALLRCRPRLDRRPRRLPVIEDFLGGREPPPLEERVRPTGLGEGEPPVLLEVRGLRKAFPVREGFFRHGERLVVKDVSFRLRRGRTLGIVGESGSGKTTLGLTLLRLHAASGGQAFFDGQDLLQLTPAQFLPLRRRIQIVFQDPFASLNPRFTVGQVLLEPLRVHRLGADDRERLRTAAALLERVGLPADALRRYPHEFSGGQRQRVAIARCLTLSPDLVICDESVSALDVSVQAQVLNLLQELQDDLGLSYLFISHDLAVVRHMSDEILVMCGGEAVEQGPADELYLHPRHPYTRRLLASIPGARGVSRSA
jgi:peptide/nickel transport system ATP-binding protein